MENSKNLKTKTEDVPTMTINEIIKKCPKHWAKVSVVSNQLIQSVELDKFLWSEKTDGEHKVIVLNNSQMYDITKTEYGGNDIKELNKIDFNGSIVLDCEEYNEEFYIFDVLQYNGQDLTKETFNHRFEILEDIKLPEIFKIKEFKPIKNLKDLLSKLNDTTSKTTHTNIDGIIIQRWDLPYLNKKDKYGLNATVYKLKPRNLLTVDFLCKYEETKKQYYLYLYGKYYDFLYNLKREPKENPYHLKHTGIEVARNHTGKIPDNLYILFDSPFISDLYYYKVDETWNKSGYSSRHIEDAETLILQCLKIPDFLDDKIVEMSLTEDNKWVPLRIRDDKEKSNGYKIGQNVVSLIFDKINPSGYFEKKLTSSTIIQDAFHGINQIYRKFIIEKHVNPLGKFLNCLDLCGGRGADMANLYANGVVNLFAVDCDTSALKLYVDKASFVRLKYIQKMKSNPDLNKTFGYEPLMKNWRFNIHGKGNLFYVNALHHCLGNKTTYENLKKDLMTRVEFKDMKKHGENNRKFEVILMNFAIHYLCDKQTNIKALTNFISEMLTTNGIFIFSYFDGEEIFKQRKFKNFDIKITKNTINVVKAMMPLPTIDAGTYREEPLVFDKTLEPLSKKLNLIAEYYPFNECEEWIKKINNYNEVIDYLKLVKVRVYGRK